jgi:hypothetical protein
MITRKLVLSGVLCKQARICKLQFDLERKKFVVSEDARRKIEEQVDALKQQLR